VYVIDGTAIAPAMKVESLAVGIGHGGYSWSPNGRYLGARKFTSPTTSSLISVNTTVVDVEVDDVVATFESMENAGLGNLGGPNWVGDEMLVLSRVADGPVVVRIGVGVPIQLSDLSGLDSLDLSTAEIVAWTDSVTDIGWLAVAQGGSLRLYSGADGHTSMLPMRSWQGMASNGHWISLWIESGVDASGGPPAHSRALEARRMDWIGGADSVQLPQLSDAYRLEWSDDGRRIAGVRSLTEPSEMSEITVVGTSRGESVQSWQFPGSVSVLGWSPDASMLVIIVSQEGSVDARVADEIEVLLVVTP
jgi:hypothetical protein